MKRLLIPLIAALAFPSAVNANWFGKYNSKAQAWEACQQWKNGQKIYYSDYAIKTKRYSKLLREVKKANNYASMKQAKFDLASIKERSFRYCVEEKETMQILGYGYNGLKEDYIYWSKSDFLNDYKVLKNFKY